MIRLLCSLGCHWWATTHVNRYQMPTRQMCRCGAVREWEGGYSGGWVRQANRTKSVAHFLSDLRRDPKRAARLDAAKAKRPSRVTARGGEGSE